MLSERPQAAAHRRAAEHTHEETAEGSLGSAWLWRPGAGVPGVCRSQWLAVDWSGSIIDLDLFGSMLVDKRKCAVLLQL